MNIKEGLVICEKTNKNVVLLNSKDVLLDYKFLTLNEVMDNLTYKVSKEGLAYYSITHKIPLSITKMYSEYIKYVDLFYDDNKLEFIKSMKKELDEKGYLIRNDLFLKSLQNKNITIFGYGENKSRDFVTNILDKNDLKYDIVNAHVEDKKNHKVYAFKNILEESRFVFNSIKDLLDAGVDINKIKIANYSDEYSFDFKRLSSFYKIPINFENKKNILSTSIAKSLLDGLDNYTNLNELMDSLKENYPNNPYLKRIVNVINSYNLTKFDIKDTKDIFKYELKNMSYDSIRYENGIDLIDFENYASKEDEHIFLIGFNQGVVPKVYLDSTYLSDSTLARLNLDTSADQNRYIREGIINQLNRKTNLTITYKKLALNKQMLPSTLIKELGYETIEQTNTPNHNEKEDQIIYGVALDQYNKFDLNKDSLLDSIYDVKYQTYDNKFINLSEDTLSSLLPSTIKLSYSSMDTYYKCPFRYYLEKVLKVEVKEKKDAADIGTYSHYILEHSYDKDYDFESKKQDALEDIKKQNNLESISAKDLFFFSQMDETIKRAIDFHRNHESDCELSTNKSEQEIKLYYDNGHLMFDGKIDKMISTTIEGKKYYAVIDFKTGTIDINLCNLEDGLHLQLPIYHYLIEKSNKGNTKLVGLYYYKLEQTGYEKTKMEGYTNQEYAKLIEPNLDATYVKNLKITQKGKMDSKAKLINQIDSDELLSLVEKLILEAYNCIKDGKFDIKPISIDNKNEGCSFCKMKDICYKKYEDVLRKEKKLFKSEGAK